MLKNYIKIAIRNLRRNSIYSLINIIGLTIGLSGATLLSMFILNELTYDNFHEKKDQLARVVLSRMEDGERRYYGRNPVYLGEALANKYNEVVHHTNVMQPFGHLDIHWEDNTYSERSWFLTDSSFFNIFSFQFLEGSPNKALNEPNSIVLTKSIAIKYFGDRPVLGELMKFERLEPMKVTGVIEDVPINSNLQFDMVISMNSVLHGLNWWKRIRDSRQFLFATTYLEFKTPKDLEQLKENHNAVMDEELLNANANDIKLHLQPIDDIHLKSEHVEYGRTVQPGSMSNIYLFGAVAFFLLLMACINYINLATSKSMQRAKEIGTRKVSGATRKQLVFQFLGEAVILSLVAFLISVFTIDILLPTFNDLIGSSLTSSDFLGGTSLFMFVLSVIIGLVAGSYPAFYLSSFKPSESLKGSQYSSRSGVLLRRILVITQFSLSIFMISATIIVYKQMNFLQAKDLGFEKESVMVIDINDRNVRESFEAMKDEFLKIEGVAAVASSSRVPGEWKNITETIVKPLGNISDSIQTYFMCFDEDVVNTFQLKLTDGRNFRGILAEDSTNILINRVAADRLGADVLGKSIYLDDSDQAFKVIGIVDNFNFQSLHQEVAPLVMSYWSNPVRSIDYFSLRLKRGANINQVINEANDVHKRFDESTAMEYHFLDEQLKLFYQEEQQAGKVFSAGALLTILISCMGLFGMASFIIQKRTKEIGVRKVLGATRLSLFVLLSKTFVLQVVIAFAVAIPFSWYVMDAWLRNFAYVFSLSSLEFIVAGVLAVLVALLSVSYRVIATTNLNPAHTLRSE